MKGGAAWAETDYSASLSLAGVNVRGAVNDNNRVGSLFGAGIQQEVWGGWSAKIEYNYINYASHTIPYPSAGAGLQNFGVHDTKQIVGHITDKQNDGKSVELGGLVSGTGAAAQEFLGNAANGYPWQASVEAVPTAKVTAP